MADSVRETAANYSAKANRLIIEWPSTANVPEFLRDTHYLRYVIAGTLYSQGQLSGREARSLTGDSRRAFEENMARYGFPLMPDDETSVVQELNADL